MQREKLVVDEAAIELIKNVWRAAKEKPMKLNLYDVVIEPLIMRSSPSRRGFEPVGFRDAIRSQ